MPSGWMCAPSGIDVTPIELPPGTEFIRGREIDRPPRAGWPSPGTSTSFGRVAARGALPRQSVFYSDITPPHPQNQPPPHPLLRDPAVRACPRERRPDHWHVPMGRQWIGWVIAVYMVLAAAAPPAVAWWFGLALAGVLLRALIT
jgi:hypothetical protein